MPPRHAPPPRSAPVGQPEEADTGEDVSTAPVEPHTAPHDEIVTVVSELMRAAPGRGGGGAGTSGGRGGGFCSRSRREVMPGSLSPGTSRTRANLVVLMALVSSVMGRGGVRGVVAPVTLALVTLLPQVTAWNAANAA